MTTALEDLQRWVASGGEWEVVHSQPERITISLLRCDGGEEAHRITTTEADVIAYVGGRARSDD